MTEKLIVIKGEKLPCEKVWVTADDMYKVYDRIKIAIDEAPESELIITDIINEGLLVEQLQ